ncbi:MULTISPECIES: ribonuclease T2 family protein [Methylococcus]|uniref:Ribonuclease T n=1 Tax=Methylococcus capsulatus TaxID=414 RepID=A0ABZ2F249_METCP|nr:MULTISPECIES: ribonuclease T [Methylococcus]MDF9391952.1 ribonuclease T [Methylococcus capsulatus]
MKPSGFKALLSLLLWLENPAVAMAVPVEGTFSAGRDCPAYVSKNKLTNPDGARVTAGKAYPVIEADRRWDARWYRLRLPSANPPERWVGRDCGRLQPGAAAEPAAERCDVAGQADAYVLALSWEPAFCELKPDKPECRLADPVAYSARHFSLHGLWPNKSGCGTDYGFCGEVKQPRRDFCDYPPITLDPVRKASLAEVMPGTASCLERHEWHKHGTCQTAMSSDAYFALAADLTRQFNGSGIADFVADRIGRTVRTEEFLARLDAALGRGARDRIGLNCEHGMLVEIRVNLPSELKPGASLGSLLPLAGKSSGSNCGSRFRLDSMGRQFLSRIETGG